ncbi:hypothetical protein [Phaeobacter sp.]|uniref:hypothetical protein n=1 Tax=Phaeobacter sp. TaxID=1902409 RepID=UPI00260123DC|nr:hypothetical protein [Phaeobacter sp.]
MKHEITVRERAVCRGYIWKEDELVELTVKEAYRAHMGRQRILIHKDHRGVAERFDVVRVRHNQKAIDVVVIGQSADERNIVRLDYHDREALGITKTGRSYELSIERLGWMGRYCWYIRARDPAIHLPSRIALLSLVLGAVGVVLSLVPG